MLYTTMILFLLSCLKKNPDEWPSRSPNPQLFVELRDVPGECHDHNIITWPASFPHPQTNKVDISDSLAVVMIFIRQIQFISHCYIFHLSRSMFNFVTYYHKRP